MFTLVWFGEAENRRMVSLPLIYMWDFWLPQIHPYKHVHKDSARRAQAHPIYMHECELRTPTGIASSLKPPNSFKNRRRLPRAGHTSIQQLMRTMQCNNASSASALNKYNVIFFIHRNTTLTRVSIYMPESEIGTSLQSLAVWSLATISGSDAVFPVPGIPQ